MTTKLNILIAYPYCNEPVVDLLKKFPKNIPNRIANIAVEIGLLLYPKSSIPIMLLKP